MQHIHDFTNDLMGGAPKLQMCMTHQPEYLLCDDFWHELVEHIIANTDRDGYYSTGRRPDGTPDSYPIFTDDVCNEFNGIIQFTRTGVMVIGASVITKDCDGIEMSNDFGDGGETELKRRLMLTVLG